MNAEMRLRRLEEADLPQVCVWRNDARVSKFLANRVKTHDQAIAWFHRITNDPRHLLVGIELDGRLAGYGVVEDVDMSKLGLRYVYGAGIALGVLGLVFAALLESQTQLATALLRVAIFASLAFAMGLVWPQGRWHWGLALAIPLSVLMAIHVGSAALSGHWHATLLTHDLPLIVGAIGGGVAGGELGSRLRGGIGDGT